MEFSSPSPRCEKYSNRALRFLFSMCGRNAVWRPANCGRRVRSGSRRTVPSSVSRNWTCRARPGCSHFVLDRTKRQAPVWRESYKKPDGPKRARWSVVGKPGRQPDYRSNLNRFSDCLNISGRSLDSTNVRSRASGPVSQERRPTMLADFARLTLRRGK